MRQYLFQIPWSEQLAPPDGWWVPSFGLMLIAAFFAVITWGGFRSAKIGLPKPKLQDMAMALFISGIVGARLLYMYQYRDQFPDRSLPGLALSFVSIWKGGIVVYGAFIGGFLGYIAFRHFVLKKIGVNGWQLADVAAPLLALGMAVGRLGCYLNGCCWGQVAIPECQPVPLAGLSQLPLLPAHCRGQLCEPPESREKMPQIHGLQTTTGFTLLPAEADKYPDPRFVVAVEPGSDAAAARLMPGDLITQVNGQPNNIVVILRGPPASISKARDSLGDAVTDHSDKLLRAEFKTRAAYLANAVKISAVTGLTTTVRDNLAEYVLDLPKGSKDLSLVVTRGTEEIPFSFTPRTIPMFPTQIYETVSMLLLVFLLVSFQPFRRHDGQVMVLAMIGYAGHRFLNEAIRIEPTYLFNLTLSQWISILMVLAAVGLEVYLWKSQPRLPKGPKPLGFTLPAMPTGSAPAGPPA